MLVTKANASIHRLAWVFVGRKCNTYPKTHVLAQILHGQPTTYAYSSLLSNPDDCVQEHLIIGPEHPIWRTVRTVLNT